MGQESRFAEMISSAAHELRSPLTSVKGFSATLANRWDRFTDEQKLQFVQTIHREAERMGRIISEVLDLARLEAGRLELAPGLVDLKRVVVSAARDLAELPGAERVSVAVADGVTVWADAARLEHVLFNLLENAVKFSDEGPIEVSSEEIGDGSIAIRVSDRGIGIEAARLDGIFEGPGPTAQRASPRGTGLGLYLSRLLVQAHGGSVEADSRPGAGSTFTVRLPAPPR